MAQAINTGSIGLACLLVCSATPSTAQRAAARPTPVASQAAPVDAAPADTTLFQSPDDDFQLRYPASWQIAPNGTDFKFHARALFGLVNANVVTEPVSPGLTLDGYVDTAIAGFKNTAGVQLKAPIERTTITVNGTPAVRLGIVASVPTAPVDLHFDQLIALVNGKAYVLTCTTGKAAAGTWKPVFDRMIASVRFTQVGASVQFEARTLPGFTLALPYGEFHFNDGDYAKGGDVVKVGDTIVGVGWSPSDHSPTTGPELQAIAQALAGGIGPLPKSKATLVDVAGPDGKPLASIRLGDNVWFTGTMCGARQISIITMSPHDSESLQRRVVRSFACVPDAVKEAALANRGSALVLDLPGWRTMATSPSQLRITDGQSVLMLMKDYPNVEASNVEKTFGPLMREKGTDVTFAPPRDGRVDFTMKKHSETKMGWMRLFRCAARNELVQALAKSKADAESLYDRVAKARCRQPGEPAQVWPDAARP